MRPLQGSLIGFGEPALDVAAGFERVVLDGHSWVDCARGWLRGADTVCSHLIETVDWRQGRRLMYDRWLDEPRLSRWYRRDDVVPHPVVAACRSALERRYRVRLAGPGLNFYRDGRDSVASHRDTELRHLDDTLVCVVTLGARRPFLLRPRGGGLSLDLSPGSGDLLVMGGCAQRDWEHAVPKVANAGPRVSASWRWSSHTGPRRPRPVWRASERPATSR
ncbi:MAG: hypothetical protein FJW88_13620 [Actinobacteria bacterium]|nr:hypothetical protein [Actinomycetota bacterium]